MKQRYSILTVFMVMCAVVVTHYSHAQKEANMWYFGSLAGVDFNSGSPVAFSGSAMTQLEGCASISDTAGSTLFYTNGANVWNKNNVQMPNGFGLLGDNNSAQAAIIVRAPGSYTTFYIFTTPTWGVGDMCYSIVDMTLQGGLGDVTIKNTPMFTNSTEKVTAVYHSNGTDIWIVGHEFNTNNFYSFLLTPGGVNPVPVITSVGTVHATALGFAGYMKASHNGQKLAYACTINMNLVEVLDFDNSTGIPSNPLSFTNITEAYGLEFSPDDSKLYATEENPCLIVQWDLNAGTPAAIQASQMVIGTGSSPVAALQLGPDRKIYLAKRNGVPFLGVINEPDSAGLACNFTDDVIPLAGGSGCLYGLPNFFQSFFAQSQALPVALFNAPNHVCPGTCTNFTNISQNSSSFIWSFPGGNPSVSTDANPASICYNSPGQYDVTLIATNAIGSDTLLLPNFITVYPYPPPQGILQSGDTLFANAGAVTYQWYQDGNLIPGATDYSYVATMSGNYNVVATDENDCEVEAVIFDVIAGFNQFPVASSHYAIFPNPVIGSLLVSGGSSYETADEISIYNSIGKKGLDISPLTFKGEIDCRSLAPGIYWLVVKSKNEVERLKFIKQ